MYHYTYVIINLKPTDSKRFYIGKRSCNCKPEKDVNYWSSSHDKNFKQSIKENKDQFKKIILAEFETKEDAINHEIILHESFDVARSNLFYNKAKQTSTGWDTTGVPAYFKGRKHTEESKRKNAEAHIGKSTWNKGKKCPINLTEDMIKKKKEMMTGEKNPFYGKHHSEETKDKIRENRPDVCGEKNPFYGKCHSEETKQKIREKLKGNKLSEETKQKISKSSKGRIAWNKGKKYKLKPKPDVNLKEES